MKNYFKSGAWNLYCDVCKRKIKSTEAKHRWDGLITCEDDWEPRHPQDFIKAKIDKITVPFARPTEQLHFNITYGMFDTINWRDVVYISSNPVKKYSDTFTISDGTVTIYKGKAFSESFVLDETGYFYNYNYTTPAPPDAGTYFSEDYVGTLASFT